MVATYLAIVTQADIHFSSDICKIILAVILPPLGVFLERGCNADFLINILLTILGYIPGIIHALSVTPLLLISERCRDFILRMKDVQRSANP